MIHIIYDVKIYVEMYLIIDVETTGLPDRTGLSYGVIPPYTEITRYSEARIVQFTAMLCDKNLNTIKLVDHIIKSDGYPIPNANIHGITDEISQEQGIAFNDVAKIISELLLKCSHIIAHNIDFDIPIIKSELYRLSRTDIIKDIESKSLFCTMKHSTSILNIKGKYGLKYPSLAELYDYVFKTEIENAHNSMYDVINLHKIIKKMSDEGTMVIC